MEVYNLRGYFGIFNPIVPRMFRNLAYSVFKFLNVATATTYTGRGFFNLITWDEKLISFAI